MSKSDQNDLINYHGERLATLEAWRKSIDDNNLDKRIKGLELTRNTFLGVFVFIGWLFTKVGKQVLEFISGS